MSDDNTKTYVTRPHLPSLARLSERLETSWEAAQITNFGPLHTQLTRQLSEFSGTDHCILFNNATTGLMATLAVLTEKKKGEVITTPFTFVATANSIVWSGNTPVFADVDRHTGCLSAESANALITGNTRAIMPVNCYGNSPDFNAFEQISSSANIPVIYDACHAFGIEDTLPVVQQGYASVVSFHATKVFNTFEGGAVFTQRDDLAQNLNRFLNFGIDVREQSMDVSAPGLNGKMSEASAAMGLLQLEDFAGLIKKREEIDTLYRKELSTHADIECFASINHTKNNYAYFPIILNSPQQREALFRQLIEKRIFVRKYFYPLVTDLSYYGERLVKPTPAFLNARFLSDRVLCLPLFSDLDQEMAHYIASSVISILARG